MQKWYETSYHSFIGGRITERFNLVKETDKMFIVEETIGWGPETINKRYSKEIQGETIFHRTREEAKAYLRNQILRNLWEDIERAKKHLITIQSS